MDNEGKLREYLKLVAVDLHETKQRLRELEYQAGGDREHGLQSPGGCREPGGPVGPGRHRHRRDQRDSPGPRVGPGQPLSLGHQRRRIPPQRHGIRPGVVRNIPARKPRHRPAATHPHTRHHNGTGTAGMAGPPRQPRSSRKPQIAPRSDPHGSRQGPGLFRPPTSSRTVRPATSAWTRSRPSNSATSMRSMECPDGMTSKREVRVPPRSSKTPPTTNCSRSSTTS
jgi:hypothetical protein